MVSSVTGTRDCKQLSQDREVLHLFPEGQGVDVGIVFGHHRGLGLHDVAVAALLAHDTVCVQVAGIDVEVVVAKGDQLDEELSSVGEIGELLDAQSILLADESVLAV